jgi:hypothetical protein
MDRCAGTEPELHLTEVDRIVTAMVRDPTPLFESLEKKMQRLSIHRRFEEAAEVRQRGALLERTLHRRTRIEALVAAGEVIVRHGSRMLVIKNAQLAASGDVDPDPSLTIARLRAVSVCSERKGFQTPEQLTEARVLSLWLDRMSDELELVSVSGTWALPVAAARGDRFAVRDPVTKRKR